MVARRVRPMSAQITRQPVGARRSVRKSVHHGSRGRRSVRARRARSCGVKWRLSAAGRRVRMRPSLSHGTTMPVLASVACQARTWSPRSTGRTHGWSAAVTCCIETRNASLQPVLTPSAGGGSTESIQRWPAWWSVSAAMRTVSGMMRHGAPVWLEAASPEASIGEVVRGAGGVGGVALDAWVWRGRCGVRSAGCGA